jgi:DNA transformation protein and related proteins
MPHTRLIQIMDQLAGLGEITERRMFGGYGLYLEGLFFGLIDRQGQLYLRADEATQADFERLGGQPFRPDSSKKAMKYWSVSDSLLLETQRLLALANHAVWIAKSSRAL